MKLTIEATEQITLVGDARCRVWKGTTASGTPCTVFVKLIAVAADQDQAVFERELREQLPPGQFVDFRKVL